MPRPDALERALAGLQARGAIGTTDLGAAIAHAERFVAALPPSASCLADLGSGGGLPGLVIAVRRPDLTVALIERRTNRADQLRRAAAALLLGPRVSVLAEDVRDVARTRGGSFDVVTARSFGAPTETARWGSALLADGGTLLVSEPPDSGDDRWPPALLASHGLEDCGPTDGIRVLRRRAVAAD